MDSPPSAPVAVLGLGVMGGSLVRDLSARGRHACCWSPDAREVAAATALAGVSTLAGPGQVAGCAGVVIATHLSAMPDLLRQVAASVDPGAWVVDLGSLQGLPVRWMAEAGLAGRGVSCHPMAGAEGSGFQASRAGLYEGVRVWTSGVPETPGAAFPGPAAVRDEGDGPVDAVHAFWREVGADPMPVDPGVHDARMGWLSHLPQAVAVHLARSLEEAGYRPDALGTGGRDMTRLAGSSPEMWWDILSAEPRAVVPGLRALASRLDRTADELEAGDPAGLLAELEAGGRWRAGGAGEGGENR